MSGGKATETAAGQTRNKAKSSQAPTVPRPGKAQVAWPLLEVSRLLNHQLLISGPLLWGQLTLWPLLLSLPRVPCNFSMLESRVMTQ